MTADLEKMQSFGVNQDSSKDVSDFESMHKKICFKEWPPCQPIVLDWRIPSDNQRVMLFERLEYLIQSDALSSERHAKRQAKKGLSASTSVTITQDKKALLSLKYRKSLSLVKKIIQLYPKKLKLYET